MNTQLHIRSKAITFLLFSFLLAPFSGKNQPYPVAMPGKVNNLVKHSYPTIYCWVDHLRIRDAASFNSNITGKLMKGDSVIFLKEKKGSFSVKLSNNLVEGCWIKIKTFEGKTGWSFSGAFHCYTMDRFNYNTIKNKIKKYHVYIPYKKTISAYEEPYTGHESVHSLVGPETIEVIDTITIKLPCLQSQQKWIKIRERIDGSFTTVYILENNVVDKNTLKKQIEGDFSAVKDYFEGFPGETYSYKSVKKYENGDDGAVWEEKSELLISFKHQFIQMGYMYMRTRYNLLDVFKDQNIFAFVVERYDGNISRLDLKFNKDGSIYVEKASSLSGLYVTGMADNY